MIFPSSLLQGRLNKQAGACILLVLSALYLTTANCAHSKTRHMDEEKIHINADHMKLNIDTGNSTYTGNVKIRQGELVLTGDTVTIIQQDDLVERINVTGKPATYTHVTDKNETIRATSQHMVYTASTHRLVLTGNARLSQPEHTVSSQKIVYDTKQRTVVAGSRQSDDKKTPLAPAERVNITLTPKKEPAADNSPATQQ